MTAVSQLGQMADRRGFLVGSLGSAVLSLGSLPKKHWAGDQEGTAISSGVP